MGLLDYYEAKWAFILMEQFGCSYSRIREIFCEVYGDARFGAYSGRDIVFYAYILLNKKLDPHLDAEKLDDLVTNLETRDVQQHEE